MNDDGGGIDPAKIKEKALNNGIITVAQAESLPDEKALMLIYTPGFSTSGSISDISGRGAAGQRIHSADRPAKRRGNGIAAPGDRRGYGDAL